MTGALNGHVRGGVANPAPEFELRPMELPDGERSYALEGLNAALAQRDPRRPALDPEMVQAIRTAYLRGWTDSRWHALRVRAAEVRRGMGEDAETLRDGARIEKNEPAQPGGRRA